METDFSKTNTWMVVLFIGLVLFFFAYWVYRFSIVLISADDWLNALYYLLIIFFLLSLILVLCLQFLKSIRFFIEQFYQKDVAERQHEAEKKNHEFTVQKNTQKEALTSKKQDTDAIITLAKLMITSTEKNKTEKETIIKEEKCPDALQSELLKLIDGLISDWKQTHTPQNTNV